MGSAVSFVLMAIVMAAGGACIPAMPPRLPGPLEDDEARSTGLTLVSGLAMLFLYGPILVLVLYSFNAAHLSGTARDDPPWLCRPLA
ncbi:MAG: hypothetical protein IPO99_18130 [Nitrospira sp.]|nr:hypothetical protein [Nitrospira sp.]